jgi:hypothetical protein
VPQDVVTRCTGLVTQYNPHQVSPGALSQADNCVILRENIVEDRRGYAIYATLANTLKQLFVYSSRVLAHHGTVLSYDDGAGTYANYTGSFAAPSGKKIRSVEAFGNCYFTTDVGVQVLTGLAAGSVRKAGAPRSLDPSYALAGSSGFLANNFQCAYRIVLKRTDANSNALFGYPSQRMWVTNAAGGSRNVTVTLYLPSEAATTDVVQVYRTAQVSGAATDSSGDEMALVYQTSPASADITAGFMTFTDSIIDDLRGASLYTSPSQETITGANERPPLCKDLALFKSRFMFYGNTSTKQRLSFTLVGASGLGVQTTGDTHSNTTLDNIANTTGIVIGMKVIGSGIPANTTVANLVGSTVTLSQAATATAVGVTVYFITARTLTLAGTTYSFSNTESTSTGVVGVSTTGVASTDIDLTARSLVRCINRYATNTTVYAYYLSGPSDLPGQLMVEERSVGGAAFTIQVSNAEIDEMIFPPPPVSPATNTESTSTNQVQRHVVYFSKDSQPEHVPALNFLPVGASNKNILRVVALRDALIVIKEDGVYRVAGDSPQSFSVSLLDSTVICKAEDSVAVLANQVFMLSNQGVVSISDTGVQVVSREIENDLKPLISFTNLNTYTTGCAYESDRHYILSTMTVSSDTAQNQTYVYNVFTRTWVRWTFGISAAIVDSSTDKLFFAKPASASVYRERKDFSNSDYADPESTITLTAISGATVTFTSSTTPEVGYVISQGSSQIAISALQTIVGGYSATMAQTPPSDWAAGAATMYPSVGMAVTWQAWAGPSGPASMKQVSEIAILADPISGNNSATNVVATVRTDLDDSPEEVAITTPAGGWGDLWGSIPWGGGGSYGARTYVPKTKQRCRLMNPGVKHKYAYEKLVCAGFALNFRPFSTRISK